MKEFFGVLCLTAFIFCLGTVGAMEQDMIDLLPGTIRAFAFLGLAALFGKLAGAFDYTGEGGEWE